MAAVVQIVDAIGASGNVLLDLNSMTSGVLLGERAAVDFAKTELAKTDGVPQWSPLTGPGELSRRSITVPVVMMAADADTLAAKAQTLMRLTAAPFLLKVQRHAGTVPVWLRCYPCAPQLKTDIVAPGVPTNWLIGRFTTDTEPYALGARVDAGPFTVTQDPSVSTALYCDVNGVTGDSLTPAVLRFPDTAITGVTDTMHISTRRRGTPSSLAGLVVQAEAAGTSVTSAGVNYSTSVPTGDSGLSGGSGRRISWTGTSGTSDYFQVMVPFAALTGREALGTYRLMVRLRRSGGAAGMLLTVTAFVGPVTMRESFTAGGNDTRVIDLGLVQVPIGQPAVMAAPESPTRAVAPTITIKVTKIGASGSGSAIDMDWVALVPADSDAGVLTLGSAPAAGVLVLDGYDSTPRLFDVDPYTGTNASGQGLTSASFIGGAPRLAPGNNRLYFVTGLGAVSGVTRAPSVSFSVGVSYWPRYGWLG